MGFLFDGSVDEGDGRSGHAGAVAAVVGFRRVVAQTKSRLVALRQVSLKTFFFRRHFDRLS